MTAHLRPHERLLVFLCRRDAAAELLPEQASRITNPSLRIPVLGAAANHDVLGLVLSTLARAPALRQLPDEQVREILRPLKLLTHQSHLWDMERERLARVLAMNHLDPVWLKGGALRGAVYGRPVERRVGDFDLLVSPEHFERTVTGLETAGYQSGWSDEQTAAFREHHFHLRLTHKAGFITEIHWALTRPSAPYRLDPQEFLRRSRVREVSSELRIRAPSAEDMLLHCATQSLEDSFSRLRRLVDLDRIIHRGGELDWSYVEHAAISGSLQGTLALSLQLARSILGTHLPPGFLARLDVPRSLRLHTSLMLPVRSHVRQWFPRRAAANWLLSFWLIPSWRTRCDELIGKLTAQDTPLAWIWHGRDSPEDDQDELPSGPLTLAKLILYQLWIYARGIGSGASVAGRRELRFWSEKLP